jgi:hypothetical protein
MHPTFIREEAARFRGMAETVGREDLKLGLLKMAADYLAKADAKDVELTEEKSAGVIGGRKIAFRPPAKELKEAI